MRYGKKESLTNLQCDVGGKDNVVGTVADFVRGAQEEGVGLEWVRIIGKGGGKLGGVREGNGLGVQG